MGLTMPHRLLYIYTRAQRPMRERDERPAYSLKTLQCPSTSKCRNLQYRFFKTRRPIALINDAIE